MKSITEFQGRYRFLSNFWPAPVKLDGIEYPTVEHAYQAAKRDGHSYRLSILRAQTAGVAKSRGRNKQGPDWHERSLDVMLDLLRQKFKDPLLRFQLEVTGGMEIIEGNTWGDTFWGQCPVGVGENHLGKLLMRVRDEVRNEHQE